MNSFAVPANPARSTPSLIFFGLVLWALGVLILRLAVGGGWLDNPVSLASVYALTIVGTWPLIPLLTRLAGLPRTATVEASALVCGTAVTIDGLVIGFAPWIYASDIADAKAVAGTLLWAIGVALILGFVRRPAA
ncbi:MAG: hypothetical protein K2X73_00330 [Sphingomonas sp.]|uniref:hypothetical protein n=1 Tax=Sphingomonas sp. TaxID=28214 RepID=UPI0025F7712C|nr:hypothetical protein [Sphingomonas sp.]MBX9880395.1 hypothetical protein [Sphingomonas sp.]